jgi:hypothetical protein
MNEPTLFDPEPPDPKNDDAPQLGRNGAHVSLYRRKNKRIPVSGPWVRHNAPDTSKEAARRVAPYFGERAAMVLAAIVASGKAGMTDDEISVSLAFPMQSVPALRGELERKDAIRLNGQTRLTRTGNKARVWVAAEFAPAMGEALP